jgi:hypothetical protein
MDRGVSTNSRVTLSNRVHRCMHGVEVALPQEGEGATLAILVWPQTLACFF